MSLPPFQLALDEHRDSLARFLAATVGPQDADDCLQETLIAALRAYPRLRAGSNVRAWLFTIARNKALDEHRARVRRAGPGGEGGPRGCGGGCRWRRLSRGEASPLPTARTRSCGPPSARCRRSSAPPWCCGSSTT